MNETGSYQHPLEGGSQCDRCKTAFPESELRPLPRALLKILAFIHLLPDSEAGLSYCPGCRSSMRSCAVFLAVVGVAGMAIMISKALSGLFR